jgi:hypothetical protein
MTIGRLAGFYTSTDPDDALRFGPRLHRFAVCLPTPLHVQYEGAGDPGLETWTTVSGRQWQGHVDIAATVREAGFDGVVVHHGDGRCWFVALYAGGVRRGGVGPLCAPGPRF